MFQENVVTKDGRLKRVVAGSKEELAEGVAAVKNDVQALSPDLHNPKEPNAIVSPDNLHTEPAPAWPVEEPEEEPEEVKVKVQKSSKSPKK